MPNLAFSPGPQRPSHQHDGDGDDQSGEKENASSKKASPPPLCGGSINKSVASAASTSSVGRSPLENLPALSAVVATPEFGISELRQVESGGGVPNPPGATDLSPPASAGGGLARSPLPGATCDGAAGAPDDAATTSTPAVTLTLTPAAASAVNDAPGGEDQKKAVGPPPPTCGVPSSAKTPVAKTPTPSAANEASAGKSGGNKKGWGFKLARAVFSPLSQKKRQEGCDGDDGSSRKAPVISEARPLVKTNTTAAAAAPVPNDKQPIIFAADANDRSYGSGSKNAGEADGDRGLLFDDEPPRDGEDQEEEGNRQEGSAKHAEGDDDDDGAKAGAVNVGGGIGRPLLVGDRVNVVGGGVTAGVNNADTAAASAAAGGMDNVLRKEKDLTASASVSRRSSSERRLSKDAFFECSLEVDHVLASASESSDSDQPATEQTEAGATACTTAIPSVASSVAFMMMPLLKTNSDNDNGNASTSLATPSAMAPNTPGAATITATATSTATNSRAPASTPISISLLPVVEPNSPGAGLEAAAISGGGGDFDAEAIKLAVESAPAEGTRPLTLVPDSGSHSPSSTGGDRATRSSGRAAHNESLEGDDKVAQGDNSSSQAHAEGSRGFSGLGCGRRRNRRHGAQLELGMAEAYGHEDHRAKFSQAELDAKIKERLAEEQAAFEKTMSALKATHEAELKAAADKLEQSSSDGNLAKIAARDAEALEREIAMLSERYGEAAAEAKTSGKILLEKEALLDAVTAQLMGLKTELTNTRTEHAADKKAMTEAVHAERRARSVAEGSLKQLEIAYNTLEDTEREKRAAGILKMKNDMKALARQQFAEANKQHAALKVKLERSEANVRHLGEAATEHEAKLKAEFQRADQFKDQVESLQKAQAASAASASRREQLLLEEVKALRNEAESRVDEMEAMSRERDAANEERDVSQDALARMAIRNTQLKESVTDLEGKVKELEEFCTEALDELDKEKAKNTAAIAFTS